MTTSVEPEDDHPPEEQRWTWEHPEGPRWLLRGDVGTHFYDDHPLGLCAAVEGLFVDLPPWPRERFTLVACTPAGALADLLDRLPALGTGEEARLGDFSVTAPPPPPGTPPSWWGEDLGDLIVHAQRPNTEVPGTVDVDLTGFVKVNDRTEAVERPGDVDEFILLGLGETPYGTCRDVTGVFREQAPPPVPRVRLLGCRPEPTLLTGLGALGQPSEAGSHRRWIYAEAYAIAADGSAGLVGGAVVSGTIEASEPSSLSAGLLDVTIANEPREPLPTGVLDILEHWRTGRPTRKNLWAGYDRELRDHWIGVALTHRSRSPDRPAGATYDLDGRFVTDIEGCYCAIGEAINGPGGYFGGDLDALDDCLHGGFGARAPFRLVWHDSAVAREHLVDGYDRRLLGQATTVDYLLAMLREHHIEVDLR